MGSVLLYHHQPSYLQHFTSFFFFSFFIFSSLFFFFLFFLSYTHPLGNRDNTTWYQILTKKKVTPKMTQINKNIQLLKYSNIKPPQFSFFQCLETPLPTHTLRQKRCYIVEVLQIYNFAYI